MEFICADTDLSTQAVLKAVCKTRAGVDHDAGRVNLAQKSLSMKMVLGQYCIGMVAGIPVNVGNSVVNTVYQLDADDRRQVFLVPVLLEIGRASCRERV